MFDPAWETHRCPGCTGWVDALGDLSLLEKRDTTFVMVSRARWPCSTPTKRKGDGASPSFRRLAATSTTTFT
jgi:predicted dithiol-disulfide oxidoreductase (DUF899 family)